MVCGICKAQIHEGCRRGTWCDCQCRVTGRKFVGTEAANEQIAALSELTAQLQEMEASGPGV